MKPSNVLIADEDGRIVVRGDQVQHFLNGKKVVDACLQLHGGYGYMNEYRVAKDYVDVRIQTIYGGTTEIMKEIIGRDLGV